MEGESEFQIRLKQTVNQVLDSDLPSVENIDFNAVNWSNQSGFLVDCRFTLEIGGKNKSNKQFAGIENAWVAADNIEYAHQNRIPLWLFGFLY